jgi:hypothetical protein
MSKRLTEEEKRYQKRQATIGLASNVLGITAGSAALATASQNKAFKNPVPENAGPVTSKIGRKLKLSPAAQKRLILGGAGGAVALQAANLGGDLVTNRVLSREVNKNDQSMISKAEGSVSRDGHGRGLGDFIAETGRKNVAAKEARLSSQRGGNANVASGVLSGGVVGGFVGSRVKRKKAWKLVDSNPHYDALAQVTKPSKKNIALGAITGAGAIGGLASLENSIARNNYAYRTGVNKAYRRFDPEADRQRRAGLYTGLGVLGAGLAGREAANHFTTKAKDAQGVKVRGVVAKPKKGKVGLGLAAVAGASGAFGAHSYKSGLSTRNQPWT